jgi:hypothetical protein
MTGSSQLRVSGATHIRLTLPSVILGLINTTGVPSDLRVSSSVDQPLPFLPVVPGLVVGAVGGQLSMVINAPNALVGFVGAFSHFYGQIVAGILPTVGVSGRFHFDEALLSPGLSWSGWRELRNYPPS